MNILPLQILFSDDLIFDFFDIFGVYFTDVLLIVEILENTSDFVISSLSVNNKKILIKL